MRLVVGITGASGVDYGIDLLKTLKETKIETHLIVSNGAERVLIEETGYKIADLKELADVYYEDFDLGAAVASGSFKTFGMVIIPCSSSTLAKVACGIADSLITRAAHVQLKERRSLVLVPRETPYSRQMIESMLKLVDAGVSIVPASPGFYHKPETISDLLGFISARILDLFGIEHNRSKRWKE